MNKCKKQYVTAINFESTWIKLVTHLSKIDDNTRFHHEKSNE